MSWASFAKSFCALGNMVAVVLAQKGENLSYRVARSADVALSMRGAYSGRERPVRRQRRRAGRFRSGQRKV